MWNTIKSRIAWLIFLDKMAIFIHFYAVRVGENIYVSKVCSWMLSDVHGWAYLKNDIFFLLWSIYTCCQLGITEHICNTVITDTVSATKILVRIIIKHAPSKATCNISFFANCINYSGMTKCMLETMFFPVKRLCWIHMSIVLCNQMSLWHIWSNILLWLTTWFLSIMYEIIIGIHIFIQMALSKITHPTRLSGIIQFMRDAIGFNIKCIVILGLIDTHAPDHNRWMITILMNHILYVLASLFLPFFITDVLPAWNFHKYQKPNLITTIDKMMRLWIVWSSSCITTQFVFQNIRI